VLPVAVTRSTLTTVQCIMYFDPVLWMTSCFHTMAIMDQKSCTTLFRRVHQVTAPAAKSLSTITGLLKEVDLEQETLDWILGIRY